MASRFAVGDAVQTPLGKGVVREIRNRGQLLIDVSGRAVAFDEGAVQRLDLPRKTKRNKQPDTSPQTTAHGASLSPDVQAAEVDLHGLTVEEALARAEEAINAALLDDRSQLRLIHGRSGGRIRAALHRRLAAIPSVRAFRLDPRNAGVTVVAF
jgi:dsDNA-specific endonuclease/ATPase MutS2